MADQNGVVTRGQTFLEALLAKYKQPKDLELDPDIFVPRQAPAKADSSGNIVLNTEILALDGCHIETVGDLQEFKSCLGSLKELDLTSNRISQWAEVFKLMECLPMLEFLCLTFNPLYNPVSETILNSSFPGVKQLVLNSTQIPWSSVKAVIPCFPNVHELHLSLNGYTEVELTGCTSNTITVLFFNGNNISDWAEVAKLGDFCPNLQTLVVSESSKLRSFGEGERCREAFPNLNSLTVSDIAVQDWEHIDTLREFPSLNQLKIQRIPLLEDFNEKERRQLLVARLPNISKLNGSEVTLPEREDAERAFIRYYMGAEDKPIRYTELELKYGKLDPLAKVILKPTTSAKVTLKCDEKEEVREINLYQTMKEFKKSLQDFVGVPVSKFRLYHMNHGADLIRPSDRKLFSFNVHDGDEFHLVINV